MNKKSSKLNVSPTAQRLYDALHDECWMTKGNLAKLIGVRAATIKALKDELEAAGLIVLHYRNNGNRRNLRHEIVKLKPRRGTPICKHFNNAVAAFWEWLLS
jgi:DNA-binding MarR family transcriptional regulator